MELTKYQQAVIDAFNRGFRVTPDGYLIGPRGHIKNGRLSARGYVIFNIRYERGQNATVFVHRLMAYQKFGMRLFEAGIQVRHKNGVCTDNSANNILLGTHQDNVNDRRAHRLIVRTKPIKEINREYFIWHRDLILRSGPKRK